MMKRTLALLTAAHAVRGQECSSFEIVPVNAESGSATWEPNVAYKDLHVTPCTTLRFEFDASHGGLYEMGSKKAYDTCNFETESDADLLRGASTWAEVEITHEHSGQQRFFACQYHCVDMMKVAVYVQDTLTWNGTVGSDQRDVALAMAIDKADASVVIVGYTFGDLSGLSAQESAFPVGGADAYLRKKSALTGRDQWALQKGTDDPDKQDRFTGVAVTNAGGIVVTGYTAGDMYAEQAASAVGAYDILLAEYDASSGKQKWGLQCCTAGADFAEGVAVHANTSVVVVGESSIDNRIPNQPTNIGGDFIAFVRLFTPVGDGAAWAEAWNFTLHTDEGAAGEVMNGGRRRDCYMTSVAMDSNGDVIAAGHTSGTLSKRGLDLATVGGEDAFVVKLRGDSGALMWQKQIASKADERVTSVRVDENDDVLIAGYSNGGRPFSECSSFEVVKIRTESGSATWENGPTYPAVEVAPCTTLRFDYDVSHGGVYLMGSKEDYDECNFETESNADLLRGASTWTEFEVTHEHGGQQLFFACQYHCSDNMKVTVNVKPSLSSVAFGGKDMIVAKLDGALGTTVWSAQLGGEGDDEARGVAAASSQGSYGARVAVAGWTDGSFSDESSFGGRDVVAVLLDASDGSEIVRTQLGGAGDDEAIAIVAHDTDGDFFVAGTTEGDEPFGPNAGDDDAFVLRLSGEALANSLASPGSSKKKDGMSVLWIALIACVVVGVPLLCFLGYMAGKIRTEHKFEALREEHFTSVQLEMGQQQAAQRTSPRSISVASAEAPGKQPLGQIDIAGRVLPAGSFQMTPVGGS